MPVRRLNQALHYDPVVGVLIWKIRTSSRAKAGYIVRGRDHEGYVNLRLDGVLMRGHRVAWALQTGRWPSNDIDHRNGDKSDNRFENLRECLPVENMQNYPTPRSNRSGYIGVSWHTASGRWQVHIRVGERGKRKRLGLGHFTDLEEAAKAYADKKASLHSFNPVTRDGIYADKAA